MKNTSNKICINLFSAMQRNLAEKDERIKSERNKISLTILRITQFALIGLQLFGLVATYFSDSPSKFLYLPPIVYIILLLPFVIEPMVACAKGYMGSMPSDTIFFLIGMLETGYIAYELTCLISGLTLLKYIIMLPLGFIVYYALCVILFNAASKHTQSEDD